MSCWGQWKEESLAVAVRFFSLVSDDSSRSRRRQVQNIKYQCLQISFVWREDIYRSLKSAARKSMQPTCIDFFAAGSICFIHGEELNCNALSRRRRRRRRKCKHKVNSLIDFSLSHLLCNNWKPVVITNLGHSQISSVLWRLLYRGGILSQRTTTIIFIACSGRGA